jgi:hypothetical protein
MAVHRKSNNYLRIDTTMSRDDAYLVLVTTILVIIVVIVVVIELIIYLI